MVIGRTNVRLNSYFRVSSGRHNHAGKDRCVDGPPLASVNSCFALLVGAAMRPTCLCADGAAGRNAIRASRVPITFTCLMRLGHCGFSRSAGSTGLLHWLLFALCNLVRRGCPLRSLHHQRRSPERRVRLSAAADAFPRPDRSPSSSSALASSRLHHGDIGKLPSESLRSMPQHR